MHEVVAARVEVGEGHRRHRAAQADRQRVDRLAPGDVAGHVDGRERPEAEVVVERQVAHRAVGIAEAHREGAVPVGDRPLDQALARREVGDVVAVDPWRDDDQRAFEHLVGGRRVLQHLDQLVAEHHRAGRGRGVPAEHEGLAVDLAGPPVVVHDVVQAVARTAHHAGAAALERALQRPWVGEQEVGGRERVGEDRRRELRLRSLGRCLSRGFDQFLHEAGREQVDLQEAVEDDVVGPRRVPEAGVGRVRVRRHRGDGCPRPGWRGWCPPCRGRRRSAATRAPSGAAAGPPCAARPDSSARAPPGRRCRSRPR